jgi:hypothetical protein
MRRTLILVVACLMLNACGDRSDDGPGPAARDTPERREAGPKERAGAAAAPVVAKQEAAAQPAVAVNDRGAGYLAFDRYVDRSEGAFLVLVPRGWSTRGGMVRVNPLTAPGGPAQSIEAKIDFAVVKDTAGDVAIRWLPKINYAQPSPYNAMLGGNWNGMPVVSMPSPQDYLTRILLPRLRPGATGVKVLEVAKRPDVSAAIRSMPAAQALLSQGAGYHVDAASVVVSYSEAGRPFREILFTAVEGYSMMGVALWSNPFTLSARAPDEDYGSYSRVAKAVINSFALNPRWLAAELRGQIERSRIVTDTLRELAAIDADIAANRRKVMADINDQQYLVLTGQERYVNPHTGREELGSNEWKHRWQNASGEVIYTDSADWDPNRDPDLNVSGYRRSPVKPRE